MAFSSIWLRRLKYRIKNPATIIITLIQPIIWLLLFSTLLNISPSPEFNNYTGFILPGIIMMMILYSCGMSGIANYTMKRNGTLKRVFMSPVKRRYILLGQMADVTLVTMAEIFFAFLAGLLLGAVFNSGIGGLLTAVVLLLPVCGFVFCLSFILSMILWEKVQLSAVMTVFLLFLILFILSFLLAVYSFNRKEL